MIMFFFVSPYRNYNLGAKVFVFCVHYNLYIPVTILYDKYCQYYSLDNKCLNNAMKNFRIFAFLTPRPPKIKNIPKQAPF